MKTNWVKKVFIIGLATVLTASLVACSGGSKSAGAPKPEEKKPVQTTAIDKGNKDSINVTLAGGSVGGFWSGLGQAISKAFANSYPGSAATYEPGSGAGNIKLVDEGKVELGLVQSVEATAGKKGLEPFTKKYENLTALALLYDNAVLQITVRKSFMEKYGVKNLEDVINKKVPAKIAVNQKGNLNSLVAITVLDAYGITEEKLKSWGGSFTWGASGIHTEGLSNGRIDISILLQFAPDSKTQEVSINTPLEVWSINENAIKKVKEEWNLNKAVIPKGTYKWQQEDVITVTESSLILAGKKATPQDQYKMAKALVENLETLKAVHPAMKSMTAEKLANTGAIPLAPGAKEYYKEIGVIK